MELCRPSDSHLEHVDFECLFSCLSLRLLLRVFGSLLLERRVIFTADKLRLVPSGAESETSEILPTVGAIELQIKGAKHQRGDSSLKCRWSGSTSFYELEFCIHLRNGARREIFGAVC